MSQEMDERSLFAAGSGNLLGSQSESIAPLFARMETSSADLHLPTPRRFNPTLTIATLYCNQYFLQSERFVGSLFFKTLYPHARCVALLLILLAPDVFASDKDFLRKVGLVETMGEYAEVENSYRRVVNHFSPIRSRLRLRVSVRRIRHVVESLLGNRIGR